MAESAMVQIQERLKVVQNLVSCDLPIEHNAAEATISTINNLHEKLKEDPAKLITPAVKIRLGSLYSQAIEEAEKEEKVLREALEKIYEIRAIRNERRIQMKHSGNKETIRRGALMKALQTSAQTLPLFMGKPGEKPPPLCGAIPADVVYVAKVGDMVAALQRSPEGDDNWILAEVVSYNGSTCKYELDDIDEEQKDKISLSRRRVIPLPLMRADPEIHPEALFRKSSIVMALYPQTTCFYKGVVNAVPTTHSDEYEVLFEDSTYPEGYSPPLKVAQRYVILHREKKSKTKTSGKVDKFPPIHVEVVDKLNDNMNSVQLK